MHWDLWVRCFATPSTEGLGGASGGEKIDMFTFYSFYCQPYCCTRRAPAHGSRWPRTLHSHSSLECIKRFYCDVVIASRTTSVVSRFSSSVLVCLSTHDTVGDGFVTYGGGGGSVARYHFSFVKYAPGNAYRVRFVRERRPRRALRLRDRLRLRADAQVHDLRAICPWVTPTQKT